MRADLPEVARPRDGRPGDVRHRIGGIGLRRLVVEPGDQDVDLGHLEAGDRDVEVEIELDQVLQLDRQDLAIPAGLLGELVVGEDVGALLRLAHVLEPDDRNGLMPERLGRGDAAMSGDDDAVLVDQDRVVEAERLGCWLRSERSAWHCGCERFGCKAEGSTRAA